jgi:hypothetical protein
MRTRDRVEIPAHTDAWMRGDRYGEVVQVSGDHVKVLMDKSGKILTFRADDLRTV